jgi:hypothetical protein
MTAANDDLALCERLTRQFYRALDHRDTATILSLVGNACVWHRAGTPVSGREAIGTALAARPPELLTRHLVCNEIASLLDDDEIEVSFELLVFASSPEQTATDPDRPHTAQVLSGIDRFHREAGGWKLVFKHARRQFEMTARLPR